MFKLLLPAIFPSWRFFESVGPAPRVEYALLDENMADEQSAAQDKPWQEFYPAPERLSFCTMLRRLFYNQHWNERLFVLSCAERMIHDPKDAPRNGREIMRYLKSFLHQNAQTAPYIQFRLSFVSREETRLETHILYTSPIEALKENTADHDG